MRLLSMEAATIGYIVTYYYSSIPRGSRKYFLKFLVRLGNLEVSIVDLPLNQAYLHMFRVMLQALNLFLYYIQCVDKLDPTADIRLISDVQFSTLVRKVERFPLLSLLRQLTETAQLVIPPQTTQVMRLRVSYCPSIMTFVRSLCLEYLSVLRTIPKYYDTSTIG